MLQNEYVVEFMSLYGWRLEIAEEVLEAVKETDLVDRYDFEAVVIVEAALDLAIDKLKRIDSMIVEVVKEAGWNPATVEALELECAS